MNIEQMTHAEINEHWRNAVEYADPTAGNAHFRFARAVLAARDAQWNALIAGQAGEAVLRKPLELAADALHDLIAAGQMAKECLDSDIPTGEPVHPVSRRLTWPLSTALLAEKEARNALASLPAPQEAQADSTPLLPVARIRSWTKHGEGHGDLVDWLEGSENLPDGEYDLYLGPQSEQKPVASIYISPNGEREFDDWKHDLPIGRNELFAAPVAQPDTTEQAEAPSDAELNELAQQHTWFNGSHAMTNYPAFARAAIARWAATQPTASAEQAEAPNADFTAKTNREYAAWCATHYNPEALDERGMVSLHGLWAWQEQERRKLATQPTASAAGEREAFEAKWPTPTGCQWIGNGYASIRHHDWAADDHAKRWEGWKARAALASKPPQEEPLSESYIQTVPDKCDRIVWRGRYYHLPKEPRGDVIPHPEPVAPPAREALHGFDRKNLETIATALEQGYPITRFCAGHAEGTTDYAARFIRAALSATPPAQAVQLGDDAIKACIAMAEDGWLMHGPEGMSTEQQMVYDVYTKCAARTRGNGVEPS